jgi:VRR-NUC domain-containing protein
MARDASELPKLGSKGNAQATLLSSDFQAVSARDGNAEARIQASIVEWARISAPDLLVFAVPNGGLRSKSEAARMKWTGTLAGVPDLAIIGPGGRAFFVEIKTPGGRLSDAQQTIVKRLILLGTPFAIARCIDDMRDAFKRWGLPTREAAR